MGKSKSRKRKRTKSEAEQHDTTTISEEDPTIVSTLRLEEEAKITVSFLNNLFKTMNFKPSEQIKNAQQEIEPQKKVFKKSILKMLKVFEDSTPENTERQERALEALNLNAYIQKQKPEDLEEFFVKIIQKLLVNKDLPLKLALSNVGYFIHFFIFFRYP